MNIDIREYIKNNFKGISNDDIRNSIEDALNSNDEITLPGLGVLFEIVWYNSSDKEKDAIINYISNYSK